MSHPSWVCGLKLNDKPPAFWSNNVTPFVGVWIETICPMIAKSVRPSHTLRGCVDWNTPEIVKNLNKNVTPFVGVWIETRPTLAQLQDWSVTPFVGVWIETRNSSNSLAGRSSHPSWVCGLKPADWYQCEWLVRSHPSWVCGLKPALPYVANTSNQSHPSWVCGLKLSLPAKTWRTLPVTPFVGVWIETYSEISPCFCLRVTPFVGVWIETILFVCIAIRVASHPSWVCGLKRPYHLTIADSVKSHPSWVCGLKHQKTYKIAKVRKVTPFVGVWIETPWGHTRNAWKSGHTLRGCVDWNRMLVLLPVRCMSHPSWVCGLKPIWFNTFNMKLGSHPSWVCGLKLFGQCQKENPR